MIYFDNGATTYPKPSGVIEAQSEYYFYCGANTGRSGHNLSAMAGDVVFSARRKLARMMGVKNPMRVVWTFNATDSLNLAIKGLVRQGWHVVTSNVEHNSTIRVLKSLENKGIITLDVIDMKDYENSIPSHANLVVINHLSNVNGDIAPIDHIGAFCRSKGIYTIIDAAQSAGIIPIDINAMQVDMVAVTGHKSLYGVQGTGALLISDNFDYKLITPLKEGGTGSLSDSVQHPMFLPDCFESGTLNIGGIAALSSGVDFIKEIGINKIFEHKKNISNYFITKAKSDVKGFCVVGENNNHIGVVTFIIEGKDVGELSDILSDKYEIYSRSGLHCSPLAHQYFGSYPNGGVRFSFGYFNTNEEVDFAVNALKEIVEDGE